MELNVIALATLILGSAGIGGALREIANIIDLKRKGVSGREDKRNGDLVAQREQAMVIAARASAREALAVAREDRERSWRIDVQEHAARLRRQVISLGGEPVPEPPEPPLSAPVASLEAAAQ